MQPVRVVFKLLVLALIPGVPIAIYLIIRHAADYQSTLRSLASELGYFGHLIFTLFAANFLRCVIQGVLCAYYKAPVQEFGIRLRLGIIPRFYIERSEVRYLNRSAKLWIYGSSLLLRLFFIVAGTLVWFLFQVQRTFSWGIWRAPRPGRHHWLDYHKLAGAELRWISLAGQLLWTAAGHDSDGP